MYILFVEDDDIIASGLEYALAQEGYTVRRCSRVDGALDAIGGGEHFDLAILDLSLPDGSGFTVHDALAPRGVPTIFLTAADDEGSAVRALETGADDYVTKPFRLRELLARIKAVSRRGGGRPDGVIPLPGGVTVDTKRAKVAKGGVEVELTALEYRLLLTLANHEGQVLSRSQLLEGIWDVAGSFASDNTLTVYIKRLRDKLEDDPANPEIIQTVRGLGYRMGE